MSFRVAPWKTYDPSLEARSDSLARNNHQVANMAEDVDMDAPQISTLREDDTPEPPPTPARTSKFRVKLLVNEGKRAGSLASTSSQKQARADSEDDDEDEEEEDQLIDDDDDALKPVVVAPPPVAPNTRGTGSKRGRGRGGGRKRGGRAGAPGVHPPVQDPGASMTWFEVAQPDLAPSMSMGIPGEVMTGPPPPARKKPGPPKGTPRAIRKKPAKTAKLIPSGLRDIDVESISEAPPTAASSPMPIHDDHSPEPDVQIHSAAAIPPIDDVSLEGVPLPVYPLPSKPFPVQPPPKIGTGFAPVIPLDRSGKPVRRWRQVNREVRGIAGGRWFAKTWVGEKESEFAAAATAASSAAVQAANAIAEREFGSSSLSGLGKAALLNTNGSSPARPLPIKPKASRMNSTSASVPLSRATSVGSEAPTAVQLQKKRNTLPEVSNPEILPVPSS
ncbi:hypothetical protein CERSUDRAFT_110834 [Gelatoporia subvermispora B]|uniref:Uncharacterized protein n=1 Tax=Ceriporiopsis subvermispora (strain B) TaxID=914234 RepID=M2RD00_CERS8|nr:hypothetical protein CERSUDRAFT_110834 [Gelatoporia subvermispora B]